ncbi:MAG TPA: hypothetical protein VH082_05220 [Rudaea sp.]|jgi:hypothetical protein|nr:hypothetical protein [Rudaea sp.]
MFVRSRTPINSLDTSARRRRSGFLARLVVGSCVGFLLMDAAFATITVGAPGGSCTFSTIQAAIDAAATTDSITVAASSTPYKENLVINGKSLTISSCPCNSSVCLLDRSKGTLQQALISGENGTTPVMKITGVSNVSLSFITVENGNSGSNDGGGISFNGEGSLTLSDTRIFGNNANYGAGINFKGLTEGSSLRLNENSFITDNIAAVSGGGIRIESGELFVMEKNTWIAFNQAKTGYGGGIEIVGDSTPRAYVASPGYNGSPVIFDNTATLGGGIGMSNRGVLVMFSSDGTQPVAIGENTAYNAGGGIFADTASGSGSVICARDFNIDNNIAKDGTAIYSNTNSNGGAPYIALNQDDTQNICKNYEALLTPQACDPSVPCNTMYANLAQDVLNGNAATDGATISLQAGTIMFANNLDMRDNHGGYAVYEHGNNIDPGFYTVGDLQSCLIADNTYNHELVLAQGPGTAHLTMTNCTLANNALGGASVVGANDYVNLSYDIIDEGTGKPALAFGGAAGNLHTLYNIAGNTNGLSSDTSNTTATPTYIDKPHGDYRLSFTKLGAVYSPSAGLDYAPANGGTDIRGDAFDFDLGSVPNRFGTRDLGAYEMQAFTDRIFVDGLGDAVQIAF